MTNFFKNIEIDLAPYFSADELDQLAKESKFVQRESKITGSVFLDLIIFNSDKLKSQTLDDLSIDLEKKHYIKITKQGLHERFNKYALEFLKMALEKMLQQQLQIPSLFSEFKYFNRILIKDSVCFQIDKSMAAHYPGSGGAGSTASVRIQFEYNLLNGTINDLTVGAFNEQDSSNSFATLELTQTNDLIIRDLAYMNLKVLKKIIKNVHAYFVARLNPLVNIYEKKDKKWQKLDFRKIVSYMKKYKLSMIEKTIRLGETDRLELRLILHLMPEQEVAKRIRRANSNNKKKKRGGLSKESKARSALNLFITNASTEQIPSEKVWLLYRLRWQVELIFKIWKSLCHIEKVKKVKKYRLECYIYSKLIFIVLAWQILWKIAQMLYTQEDKILSFYKAFKTLIKYEIDNIRNAIIWENESINAIISDFYELSKRKLLIEYKKQDNNPFDVLLCL